MATTFIHTSDWQLGMTRHFLGDESQTLYSADRLDAVTQIGYLADKTDSQFVIVSGDIFESNHVDRTVIVRTLERLSHYSVPVYLLPGNHDPLDAGSIFHFHTFVDNKPDNVFVIGDMELIERPDGTEILGIPWRSKQMISDEVSSRIEKLDVDSNVIRIVLAHGIIDKLSPDPYRPDLINLEKIEQAVHDGRVSYVALGDRHSSTEVGTSQRVWYSGTPVQTDFDEIDPSNVLLVNLDIDSCRVETHKIGKWSFIDRQFDINSLDDLSILENWLDKQATKDRKIVRLALEGAVTISQRIQLDLCIDKYRDLFASIEIWESHSNLVDLPEDFSFLDFNLSGFAAETTRELIEKAKNGGNDSVVARDAITELYKIIRRNS